MGKADRHIKKFQKQVQLDGRINPTKNLATVGYKFYDYYAIRNGQEKFINDLTKGR